MALIEWSEDLATGIPRIDGQHKELFARINGLLEACHEAKGRETVGGMIAFLEKYVIEHFAAEEEFMAACGYPGLERHRAEHAGFVRDFAGLKARFAAEGPGVHIVVMTNHAVVDWLNRHIRNSDKALGAFVQQRPEMR